MFRVFLCILFMPIILCIYVYIVNCDYLCVFIPMKEFLYRGNSTVTELHLERFFFNHHSIAEHILTENLLIIEILLQVMK